jgi:signal transduction histidine kinase/DNA-binding response OmpR family regulator
MNLLTKTSNGFNNQNYTALIVDDESINLGVMSEHLDGFGIEVLIARDGEEGLQKAWYARPDIILLDVMMPGIDGFETCRRLKANQVTKDIPVIFMSGLSSTESKLTGFEVGAVDYLTKPLQQEEVLARVATHLRLRNLTKDLQKKNMQLEISSQVGHQITSILDLDQLLKEVVSLIQTRFGYYFVGVWLLDKQQDHVTLRAGAGDQGGPLLEPGFGIPLDTAKSIIVEAYRTGQSYAANDVSTDVKYLPLETLSETHSELALPLRVGQEIIGVLDIQSEQKDAFDSEDKTVLQALANQIAVAIRNAQLYESEKELRRLEAEKARELAKLNVSKDKFFSIIAHDLKGSLVPLLGYADLLGRIVNDSDLDIKRISEKVGYSARHVSALLEDLLQWGRMQMNHIEYEPGRVNLKPLVHDHTELLTGYAKSKRITLQNKLVKPIFVYGDENMLKTVIRNLISNGIKFTPDGGTVTISAEVKRKSQQKETTPFVEVAVSDTGIGISQDNLKKIFKLEEHYKTTGTAKEKGTGLGLIICQEMIEKHGGQIWLESDGVPGQGTIVKFTLPLVDIETIKTEVTSLNAPKSKILSKEDSA